jgi:hypothetical protein
VVGFSTTNGRYITIDRQSHEEYISNLNTSKF